MTLLFASNNAHKLEEVRGILPASITILSLAEVGFHAEIDETGQTLEENSQIKADTIHRWLAEHPEIRVDGVFADDTGLEIEALGGKPGVRTARWAGEDCVAANNRAKALSELQGVTHREARFRTVVTLIRGEQVDQVDGIVPGRIATEERGEGGFGYDPVFIPEGYDVTFAELPAEVKNSISHRARAMQALRRLLGIVLCLIMLPLSLMAHPDQGSMGRWRIYSAYSSTSRLVAAGDELFALSGHSLFSVDPAADEPLMAWNKVSGLSATQISQVAYDAATDQTIVVFSNGLIDFIRNGEVVMTMSDLYLKSETMTIAINSVSTYDGYAFLATSFGVVQINLSRHEVAGTYYIGPEGKALNVSCVAVVGDTIYAASAQNLYRAFRGSVLEDYSNWKILSNAGSGVIEDMVCCHDRLYVRYTVGLYAYQSGHWSAVETTYPLNWLRATDGHLLAGAGEGDQCNYILACYDDPVHPRYDTLAYYTLDAVYMNGDLWLAADQSGAVWMSSFGPVTYKPDGPYTGTAFRMQFAGDKLFVAPGGRWSDRYMNAGDVVMYEHDRWSVIPSWVISDHFPEMWSIDIVNYAVDPYDHSHFFANYYGYGMVEFRNNAPYRHFTFNSGDPYGLESAVSLTLPTAHMYVRTDGAVYDADGNIWVLNADNEVTYPLKVYQTKDSTWFGYTLNGQKLRTPGLIHVDSRHPNWKWFSGARSIGKGIHLFDDNGTLTNTSDDRYLMRTTFVDQKGTTVEPEFYYCTAQDRNGALWVGTEAGVFVIDHEDFFTSNRCHRPLIPRNDGSGLADYLLQTERINAIAVDGANRKWIGTQSSGLYLVSPDGLETIQHFTEENSFLPSSTIISLAINSISGDVFVGTSNGIAAYRSDATVPADNFAEAYAYPNPVRPDYEGLITITNLMDNTWVNIQDGGGNLVYRTRSYGGSATWNGTNQHGERVGTGVYSALCTAGDGSAQTVVKILILN